jgi:arylsulfatase
MIFGPRGVPDCKATDRDDPTEDHRFGGVGEQTIKDTGPLTRKRMETADEEFLDRTMKFIRKNNAAKKPWFAWLVTSRPAGSQTKSCPCRTGCRP